MIDRFRLALVASALLAPVACNRANKTDKAEQRAAIDDAYQSGLLTKDEYEAKKLALAPVPVPAQPSPSNAVTNPTPVTATAPPAPAKTTEPLPQTAPPSQPGGDNTKEPEPAPLRGCEAPEFKSGGRKGIEEHFFAAPPDVVRHAAVSALDSLDFIIHKNSSKEIDAAKKRHIGVIVGAGGERVILTFGQADRGGQSGTRVIGETRKSFVGRVAQKTWTDAVLAQMDCLLRQPQKAP